MATAIDSIVSDADIAVYAKDVINLPRADANRYREQVNRLRELLEGYIESNPEYGLVKMLNAGSVAKGTALSSLNDMDVAVYLRPSNAPSQEDELLDWLADRLREANPNLAPEQIEPRQHCVRVSYRGSGLDIDVAPVLYEDQPNDCGYLVDKHTGERVLTSIPLHLKFIRSRKERHPEHLAQLIRLMKWWIRQRKIADPDFRLKSFLAELVIAHRVDAGLDPSGYSDGLERIFAYIVESGLKHRIAFADYYQANRLPPPTGRPIEVFDPVNPANNVAGTYTEAQRLSIVEAAADALDALTEARYATTKARAVAMWRVLFGPSFRS